MKHRTLQFFLFAAVLVLPVLQVGASTFGTGFLISDAGYIATSAHNVPEGNRVTVLTRGGASYNGVVVFRNDEKNVACIKVEGEFPNYFPIGDSNSLRALDTVYTFGFPVPATTGSELSAERGRLQALPEKDEMPVFSIDTEIQPGMSGGALVNKEGRVVGIAVSSRDPIRASRAENGSSTGNHAVPVSAFRAGLQKHQISFDPGRGPRGFEAIRALATEAMVQILSYDPEEITNIDEDSIAGSLVARAHRASVEYILLGNSDSLDEEMRMYAPEVNFYDSGVQDLDFIRGDLTTLREKWPNRFYVVDSVEMRGSDPETGYASSLVKFRFALINGDRFYKGEAQSFIMFDMGSEEPKVVLVYEHKTKKERSDEE